MSDWFARSMTMFFRFLADVFFTTRYGHRAVVLETVAGVPKPDGQSAALLCPDPYFHGLPADGPTARMANVAPQV